MMADSTERERAAGQTSLREIPQWADRYARHRVLAVLFMVAIAMGVAALIGALTAGAVIAWRGHHRAVGSVLLATDLAFCVWWLWLVRSRRIDALVAAANRWMYRKEGEAAPAAPASQETRLDKVVALAFAIAICATPMVCERVHLPLRYLQPLTAAYLLPFMVYRSYRQRLFPTQLMLLYPGLYAVHALLVLAGVPLLANIHPIMSALLPIVGYQLLAVLVAHLYSRYALRRLRTLTRRTSGEGSEADGGD
jgi:hypothetical protein